MNKKLLLVLGLLGSMLLSSGAQAALSRGGEWEAQGVQRAYNIYGLTGLYYSTSPYGLPFGHFSFSASTISDDVFGTITPISVGFGLTDRFEIAITGKLVDSGGTTGVGDTDIYAKYRFRTQTQYLPAMAIMVGVTSPTSTFVAANETDVQTTKISLIAGSEARVTETMVIGFYLELQGIFRDSGQPTADRYTNINLGMMMPISDDDKLQLLIDTHTTTGKTIPTLGESDGSRVAMGIRYNTRLLKYSMGVETGGGGYRFLTTLTIEL